MNSRWSERGRFLAADLREARVSPILGGLLGAVYALVFYPYTSADIPASSEWVFWEFGLSREGLFSGKFWQLVTHAFLHGPRAHLLINLVGLLLLGSRIERIAGPRTLLKVFTAGVVVGGIVQVLLSRDPDQLLVGASGGISAMLLWMTTVAPEARAWPIPVTARNLGRGILASEAGFVIATWVAPGSGLDAVAHACHLGGGLAGLWLGKRVFRPLVTREDLAKERARHETVSGP